MSDRTDNLRRIGRTGDRRAAGFTMLEVLAALEILALASVSVLLVIDRCLASASDSTLRMAAFELVRENMEKVLVSNAVEETADFGTSEEYPGISWQTVIEGFSEPVGGQMWVRAVCSADYLDSKGDKQKVEMVHWITQLTDQQAGQLVDQQDLEKLEAEQTLRTDEDAAAYAKIDTETLRKWVADGLLETPDGAFLRCNLDIFVQNKGNPTPEQKAEQVESVKDLALKMKMQEKASEQEAAPGTSPDADGKDGATTPSNDELKKMSPGQIRNLVNRRKN